MFFFTIGLSFRRGGSFALLKCINAVTEHPVIQSETLPAGGGETKKTTP
jgi:hypothetical protein